MILMRPCARGTSQFSIWLPVVSEEGPNRVNGQLTTDVPDRLLLAEGQPVPRAPFLTLLHGELPPRGGAHAASHALVPHVPPPRRVEPDRVRGQEPVLVVRPAEAPLALVLGRELDAEDPRPGGEAEYLRAVRGPPHGERRCGPARLQGGGGRQARELAHDAREVSLAGRLGEVQVVVVGGLRGHLLRVDDGQARDLREGLWVPREVGEELALAEEDGRVVGVRRLPELYAEEAAIDLVPDVLRLDVALGEEAQPEADSC